MIKFFYIGIVFINLNQIFASTNIDLEGQYLKKNHYEQQSNSYGNLCEIINDYNFMYGVHIGKLSKGSIEYISQHTNIKKMYLVDQLANYDQEVLPQLDLNFEIQSFEVKSIEVSRKFKNHSLDFAYIKKDCTHQELIKELEGWFDKVSYGGFLLGQNYNSSDIKEALEEFFLVKNLKVIEKGDFWWVRKPHMISFIIPTYNRADTIARAIESIYNQNLAGMNFEVIVVDDSSTDSTKSVLEEYTKRYSNFYFLHNENNLGTSVSRNKAIDFSQGDLVFSLDSDNYLDSDSILPLLNTIDQFKCDAAFFNQVVISYPGNKNKGNKQVVKKFIPGEFSLEKSVRHFFSPVAFGNYLFTKRSWYRAGKYRGRILETWDFGTRQLATNTKIFVANKGRYIHEVRSDSKWVKNERQGTNQNYPIKVFLSIKDLLSKDSVDFLENFCLADHFVNCIDKNKFQLKLVENYKDIIIKNQYRFMTEDVKLLKELD